MCSSKPIFIDANLYLMLYCKNDNEAQKIIDELKKIKNLIFVSLQIVNEVRRNAVRVALSQYQDISPAISFSSASQSPLNSEIVEVNKKLKEMTTKIGEHATSCVEKVSKGEDIVSIGLKDLFDIAADCTDTQLQIARERRERGNPPGKKGDTLGDQITWGQFLDKFNGYNTNSYGRVLVLESDYSEDTRTH